MKFNIGTFNTNKVNLDKIQFPASTLMRSEEEKWLEAFKAQSDFGMPSNIQHDASREFGWANILGHYIDGEMVRTLGYIEEPESATERAEIVTRTEFYWKQYHKKETEPYLDELVDRLSQVPPDGLDFFRGEAVFARKKGLAAQMYPSFFDAESEIVDKDGLVFYKSLISHTVELMPGIFHDKKKDLILVAHRFFRRGQIHKNSLNSDFIDKFCDTANQNPELNARIRLDPDLLGHPGSVKKTIELEYWHGPKFCDDISKIPNGVAEHKADNRTQKFEAVDRTQIWWKAPETRWINGCESSYRTFEIEELVEDTSPGFEDNQFCCRYAHAEYSSESNAITHFDGAVRAYGDEVFLERIDRMIDRAGKQSVYTKLFRFDGELPVSNWKSLLSCFYRGNYLIPEYLGAPPKEEQVKSSVALPNMKLKDPNLWAFIALSRGQMGHRTMLAPKTAKIKEQVLPYVEVGTGAVSKYLLSMYDDVSPVGFRDKILNLSAICISDCDKPVGTFEKIINGLSEAMRQDIEDNLTKCAAIPLAWKVDEFVVKLTIAGKAAEVLGVIEELPVLIELNKRPSEWIDKLAELIAETAPIENAIVNWEGVDEGFLKIPRDEEAMLVFPMDSALGRAS